jgi:hypothetical protein
MRQLWLETRCRERDWRGHWAGIGGNGVRILWREIARYGSVEAKRMLEPKPATVVR